MFKASWFLERHHGTQSLRHGMTVFSVDTAYKPGQQNDPSVIEVWHITKKSYELLHVWRDRVDYPTLKKRLIALDKTWSPDAVLVEDKASGQSLIQELKAHTRIPVIAIEPEGDKLTRANEVSSHCEAGLVILPHAAPWLLEFEQELFGFPLSTHDDQVDSLTQLLKWAHHHLKDINFQAMGKRSVALAQDAERSRLDTDSGFGRVRGHSDFEGF